MNGMSGHAHSFVSFIVIIEALCPTRDSEMNKIGPLPYVADHQKLIEHND